MKKLISFLTIFVFAFSLSIVFTSDQAFAAKKKKGGATLNLKARDGGSIIYGSVLNAKENEVKAKLPKNLLSAIRSTGVDGLSITITKLADKAGDTSNIYTLNPSDSVDLFGKFININLLSSLTDVAGSTYTAGALPEGKYELSIVAGNSIIKGNFDYKPPVVVVGTVSGDSGTCSGGTNQVNTIGGDALSRSVALSNCSYFNEVQAARITDTKKARKLRLQIAEGDTTAATSETPPAEEVPSEEEIDLAISQAVTPEGILSAPVELNPEDNGSVQYDITPSSTEIVQNALSLLSDEGELSEEDLALAEDILRGEVNATSVEEIEGEIEGLAEGEEDDFIFDPSCPSKIEALFTGTLPEEGDFSDEQLLAFAHKVIDAINSGELTNCLPKFVSEKILPALEGKGDKGLIAFAKRFIFHMEEDQRGPDPKMICKELDRGLQFLKECRGRFCPPPPCFPSEMRDLLKGTCPDVLALVPEGKCVEGPRACNIMGPPPGFGGPGFGPPGGGFGPPPGDFGGGFGPPPGDFGGGFGPPPGSFGGGFGPAPSDFGGGFGPPGFIRKAQTFGEEDFGEDEGCIDFKPPEPPNFCVECASDDDCHGPKDKDPNAECDMPTIACIPIMDFDGNERKVCHLNGKPKDPFSCREFPGPDQQECDVRPLGLAKVSCRPR